MSDRTRLCTGKAEPGEPPRIMCEACGKRRAEHRVYVRGERSRLLCYTCQPMTFDAAFALDD